MKLKGNISILALLFIMSISAQTIDTLSIARDYYTQKNYVQSALILHKYLKNHPKDVYTCWLYGQVAHEAGYNTLSDIVYSRAVQYAPDNRELRLSYARSLFYSKQLKKAEKEFLELVNSGADDAAGLESYLMLAYINYWNQNYKNSEKYADKVLEKNPKDKLALELKEGIVYSTSPYVKLDLEYLGDNQTLNSFSENVEIGVSKSNYVNPKLSVKNQNFDTHEQVLIANIGNTFSFNHTGLSLYTSIGGYKHFSEGIGWLGEAELRQKISKHILIKAGVNRLPYLYTLKSTRTQVYENNAYGIIDYDNPGLFSVHALYQHKFFNDNNSINIFGGWILSKYFKINIFEFRAGYGFSYSDSKKLTFYPEEEVIASITDYPLGSQLPGIYDPYFTPNNQYVHSVIGAFKFKFSPKFSLDLSGTYAFYAKNDSPILFFGQNAAGKYIYTTYFYKEENHPFDIKASLNYLLSDKLSLGAYYQYQENSFYNQNKAGTTFFYKF